jgi:phage baseplate assembly protein W
MNGHSAKLPLSKDNTDGLYGMNKTAEESIKQNFKMLLLTNPGERIMLPEYGVGLRQILFEQNTEDTKGIIVTRINEQVRRYLNVISVGQIIITDGTEDDVSNDLSNLINVKIYFSIPFLGVNDELNIDLSSN